MKKIIENKAKTLMNRHKIDISEALNIASQMIIAEALATISNQLKQKL